MYKVWLAITESLPYNEALAVWNERTDNGTKRTTFQDIDYYRILEDEFSIRSVEQALKQAE